MSGVSGVSGGQQTYEAKDSKKSQTTSLQNDGMQYVNTALSTAISGGDIGSALGNQVINNTLDNLGVVGKGLKLAYNLLTDRKSESATSKQQTGNQVKLSLEAQKAQIQTFSGNIQGIIAAFQSGGTVMSLQTCENKIKDAVTQIQDKEAAKQELKTQQEELVKQNEELASKISALGVTIVQKKDGGETQVEFVNANGEKINEGSSNKKDNNISSENSELNNLINQYLNNNNMIMAISNQIIELETVQVEQAETGTEEQENLETNKDAAKQEVETLSSESLSNMRSEISNVYNQVSQVIGEDATMHKIYENVDKGLAAAQTAAAVGAFITGGSSELLEKAANNMIAAELDKAGKQIGLDGLGEVATGKVSVENYATNLAVSELKSELTSTIDNFGSNLGGLKIGSAVSDKLIDGMKNINQVEQA